MKFYSTAAKQKYYVDQSAIVEPDSDSANLRTSSVWNSGWIADLMKEERRLYSLCYTLLKIVSERRYFKIASRGGRMYPCVSLDSFRFSVSGVWTSSNIAPF